MGERYDGMTYGDEMLLAYGFLRIWRNAKGHLRNPEETDDEEVEDDESEQ